MGIVDNSHHIHGPQCVPETFWGKVELSLLRAFGSYKHEITVAPEDISIEVKDLSVSYGSHRVLKDVSCEFKPKDLVAIVGPNGGGKSTFLKALLGVQQNITGTIRYEGLCPYDVAYLAQHNQLDRRFPLTVGDVVSLGLFKSVGLFKRVTKAQQTDIMKALERVGMSGSLESPLQALSGGQFQRVLFARLILQDSPIIFLDEPFTGVDTQTTEDLMQLVQEWHQEGRMVISVLHDMDIVQKYFPHTLLLARGIVAWGKTADVLSKDNLLKSMQQARGWEAMEPCYA